MNLGMFRGASLRTNERTRLDSSKGIEIKLLRDKVNCLVKSAKMKYYCDLFQDAKGNAKKKVWNEVNEVCYRNSTSESVQCIISDEIQHTTPKSIASAMNSFFASIGKRLADKITTT